MRFNKFVFAFFLLVATAAWAEKPLVVPPDPEMETAAANATEKDQPTKPSEASKEAEKEQPEQPEQNVSADNKTEREQPDTLSILSNLRTTKEIRKVQVEIAKMDNELRELRTVRISSLPQLMPPAKRHVKSSTKSASRPKVVAVEGVGAQLRAVLRTRSGLVTVKTGDRIGSGKVSCIEPNRVMVRYGHTEIPLNFVE